MLCEKLQTHPFPEPGAQNTGCEPGGFIAQKLQRVGIPEQIQRGRKVLVAVPEPQANRQIFKQIQLEAKVAPFAFPSAQRKTRSAEIGWGAVDGALQRAGGGSQTGMDMSAQKGHGHGFPGGGAAGAGIAEVVVDGQHFAVGVGGQPAFAHPAEQMPVGAADAQAVGIWKLPMFQLAHPRPPCSTGPNS